MMTKPVYRTVIFGAGQIGQMTARLLNSPCQLLCFADNDPHKHGSYIGNIPVCSPDTAAALLPDLVILGVLDEERRNSMIKQMENFWVITDLFVIPPSFACLTHGLLLCVFYLSRSINWIFREMLPNWGFSEVNFLP